MVVSGVDGSTDTLVFCQHPAVISVGRATQQGSILIDDDERLRRNIDLVDVNRGGEATVHNPGQLVGYPLFDLRRHRQDLHWYLRTVEQCIIDALATVGLVAGRVDGYTGVWIDGERKICAIGISCRSWIVSHGFALNVDNDLSLFDTIIPCGIRDRAVTSIYAELGTRSSFADVELAVEQAFRRNFGE